MRLHVIPHNFGVLGKMSEFDELVIRARAEIWAMGQVESGFSETRIVREGPRAYTVPTQRALRIQAEIRRLTEERVKVLTAEKLAGMPEQLAEDPKTLWEHLDDER